MFFRNLVRRHKGLMAMLTLFPIALCLVVNKIFPQLQETFWGILFYCVLLALPLFKTSLFYGVIVASCLFNSKIKEVEDGVRLLKTNKFTLEINDIDRKALTVVYSFSFSILLSYFLFNLLIQKGF